MKGKEQQTLLFTVKWENILMMVRMCKHAPKLQTYNFTPITNLTINCFKKVEVSKIG